MRKYVLDYKLNGGAVEYHYFDADNDEHAKGKVHSFCANREGDKYEAVGLYRVRYEEVKICREVRDKIAA